MGTIFNLYKTEKAARYELGKGEWFRICKNDNIVIFKMPELWTVDNLTKFVRKALSVQGGITIKEARETAESILRWSGDDPMILVPDTFDHVDELEEVGAPARRHRKTGNRWDIYNGVIPARLSPSEYRQNEKLRLALHKEQDAMMTRAMLQIARAHARTQKS